jgi:hypothetical protein
MKKIKVIGLFLLAGLMLVQIGQVMPEIQTGESYVQKKEEEKRGPSDRNQYFYKMLHDPATGKIPDNIRQKEIEAVKNIPTSDDIQSKGAMLDFDFTEVGPNNVGGRTRALALDVTNSNVIIAGVSQAESGSPRMEVRAGS